MVDMFSLLRAAHARIRRQQAIDTLLSTKGKSEMVIIELYKKYIMKYLFPFPQYLLVLIVTDELEAIF